MRRDWTQGNVLRNLLSLAWPIIISSGLNNIGPTIDMIWVGKLGAASVAGVGVAGLLVQLLDMFKMGLDMGTRALISRHFGAGDKKMANHVAVQGYVVTIAFAAIVGTAGAILAAPIMRLLGLAPDVVARGAPYLRIQFIGILTQGLVRQNEGTMQSSGDAINPMRISIIYRIFHVALSPFLIFGWWIFPRLETSGAAYTGIISACLGAVIGLWLLISGRTRLKLRFNEFHPDPGVIWRIIKVGVPASITGVQRSLGQLLMAWFVVPFGTVAVAAHSLTQRIDQFVQMGATGFGQASGVLAAQNLGAGRTGQAEKSGWLGAYLCTVVMAACCVLLWFFGTDVVRLFNSEQDLVLMGNSFLRIQMLSYLMFGFAVSMQNCLNGLGDTIPTMFVVLIGTFAVQVPLAYFLSRQTDLGAYGTRWAIAIGTLATAACYAAYFAMGRWKRKTV